MDRPSALMRKAIEGHLPLAEAPQSALSFLVYRLAKEIMRRETRQARRDALEQVPVTIRAQVRDEVMRLWNKGEAG